jgi:hypothetical protein
MRYLRDANEGKGALCYLSGPITHDTSTTNWRPPVMNTLRERFGVSIFDPFSDPKQNKTGAIKAAKEAQDKQEVQRLVSGFVRKDLAVVDRSDFVLARFAYKHVYFPEDLVPELFCNDEVAMKPLARLLQVPTTGTIHEIINSDLYHKPTLLVSECGWWTLPEWLLGFIPTRYWFSSFEEVYDYLQDVDRGKHMNDDRWALVYGLV